MFDFKDKAVIVTGAGAGIGCACARQFAKAGAWVVVNSLSASAAKVAEEIQCQGGKALFIQADVSKEEEVQRLVEQAIKAFGRLDVLVNVAGIVEGGSVEETTLESWNRVMAVNATGTFLLCKYAVPYLRQSKGVIVNTSSLVATKGIAGRAAYSASKGAVLSLSRAMAADYLKDGIRVNCVSPGTVMTPSLQQRIAQSEDPESAMAAFIARQPMGRLGEAEEVATAILFAASGEAAFLDGANIQIDGGASM